MRTFVSPRKRWFFEGCMHVPGQLWLEDRKLLYETIRHRKPQTVFEVGTWYGGGSTYFISQAMFENKQGVLHTIEADPEVHSAAVNNYRTHLPHLLPYVRFHRGKSTDVYPAALGAAGRIDAVFLDGAAVPEQTLTEFEMFAPFLAEGSILLMHDWDNIKMEELRPRLEGSSSWRLTASLTAPHSVGFAAWERVAQDT